MAENKNETMKQGNHIRNRDITWAADGEALEEGVAESHHVDKDEQNIVERPE